MKISKYVFATLVTVFLFIGCQLYLRSELSHNKNKDSFKPIEVWSKTFGYTIIAIDEELLDGILTSSPGTSGSCQYLCVRSKLVFALDSRSITSKDVFLTSAKLSGLNLRCSEELVRQRDESVITDCSLELSWGQLEFVILYERSGFYWFKWNSLESSTSQNRAAVLDKFETRNIELDGIQLRIPRDIPAFLADLHTSHFIECNATRADTFFALYGRDISEQAQQFRDTGIQLIRTVKSALDQLKIPFWLSSGTCLGWYRQCDVIPYSRDIDVGVFTQHYSPVVIPALQRSGLRLKHKFGLVSDSLELSFVKGDIKLDIFFFYEETNYTWNGGTQAKTGNKYKYIFQSFSLCWTEFFDLKVRIPCDTERYIIANYGADWFKPVKTWDWKESPPNVQVNGQWTETQIDEAVQIFD